MTQVEQMYHQRGHILTMRGRGRGTGPNITSECTIYGPWAWAQSYRATSTDGNRVLRPDS